MLLAGCGNREAGLVGSWAGQLQIPESLAKNPQAAPFLKEFDTNARLELKPDHTYRLSAGGATSSGIWTLEKDAILLTVKTAGGKSIEQFRADAAKTPGMSQQMADEAFSPLRFRVGEGDSELIGEATPGSSSGAIILKKLKK